MQQLHVYDAPPPGVAPDWTMPQNWEQYGDADHKRWRDFAILQTKALDDVASAAFIEGLHALGLDRGGVPEFDAFNSEFKRLTGWTVVAVPGVIPEESFFRMLSERRFPVANFLRQGPSFDYSEEPDMFHDVYGHLPMFVDPTFGEFMAAYGRAGLRAEKLGTSDLLSRLYLHTIEFGLIREGDALKAYGAGLLSSKAEAIHAVSGKEARRLEFDLQRVMRTEWYFDKFQPTYFVIDSFEALLEEMETTNLRDVYAAIRDLPLLAPGEAHPDDREYAPVSG